MKKLFARLAAPVVIAATTLAWVTPSTPAHAVGSLLDQCVASINDAAFTKAFILSETGFADEASLLSAVTASTWTIQISTGPGWNPTLRGMSPDIYCGGSGNDTVSQLDSNPSGSHDFFFGGAGNDSVDTMWDSRFWGGDGDDVIYHNRERSIFYGGAGTNQCLDVESTGAYIATCYNNGGPLLAQSALVVSSVSVNVGSTLSLTTTGGSGSGAVTFAVTTAGSAGCTVSGSTLSHTSYGTCTVTATKAADSTYSAVSSTATTVTVSRLAQSAVTLAAPSALTGTTVTLAASGGSGTGALSYAVTAAGSAGCSLVGAVLSATGPGTCTVTATKAADATYLAESTGAITATFTAPTTTTSTTTTTVPVTTTTVAPTVSTVWSNVTTTTYLVIPASTAASLPVRMPTTTTTAPPMARGSAVSTSTTVPPTTTTAAPGPVTPLPPDAGTSGAGAIRDGQAVVPTVSRANNEIIVEIGTTKLRVAGTVGTAVSPLGADGSLQLTKTSGARIGASGFKPGLKVTVWLFSTPSPLGSVVVDDFGNLEGTFPLPPGAKVGHHRVVVDGQDAEGKAVTFAVAATIADPNAVSGSSFNPMVLVLPLLIAAAGALFLPAALRRRRDNA